MSSMPSLPDEIWVSILDFLDPEDVISLQRVSKRLLKLARDGSLWRNKCFEKAPSASTVTLDALSSALGGLSLPDARPAVPRRTNVLGGTSRRAQRIAKWDHTGEDEDVDWYSEYVGRHAPFNTTWSENPADEASEIRGVAVNAQSTQAVGCREDGSVAIWDIQQREYSGRRFRLIAQSKAGILLQPPVQSSSNALPPSFSGVVECVCLDEVQSKAYIAVDSTLNEVDLETLSVISQETYAWKITALSQQAQQEAALSVGTTWSLHLYDPRVPMRDRSRSPEDLMRSAPGSPEDSIAFLPNYNKGSTSRGRPLPTSQAPTIEQLAPDPMQYLPKDRRGRIELSDYAHVEPGPLSILHQGDHDILVAGRFPSILTYDRRFFPRLQSVIHSGARLSSLASFPYPPKTAHHTSATATLIAAGEYGGRGSLELYSLPHGSQSHRSTSPNNNDIFTTPTPSHTNPDPDPDPELPSPSHPYAYKNRQEASPAKLLSVATQGTRIVFSDAEGGLKWVERDGRGLVRRWNINDYVYDERGGKAGASGELVARKIVPLLGKNVGSGNADLLIWTGEKLGIVSTTPRYEDHEELVREIEGLEGRRGNGEGEVEREREQEYAKTMRAALERQADERRWMSRFRLKRGLF